MKTFLGIGSGPIQTGIFVSGAISGGFERIVLADVDTELVKAVRQSGNITVNTSGTEGIRSDVWQQIEIYNPTVADDLKQLKVIAAEAMVVVTALPSTAFYRHLSWLREAFELNHGHPRYVYAAENSTTAAAELCAAVGTFPQTYYLDTVIGKMSKVFTTEENNLPPLAPGLTRGHLVEEFNTIYTSSAPGIDAVGIVGLQPKAELEPFEEAKLYGHNAVHFLLGTLAARKGCRYISETVNFPELIQLATIALRDECGVALCRKFAGVDSFFTTKSFNAYAEQLITRMVSPLLNDSVERVIRDLDRKLGWNDRIVGAIRLCLSQNILPSVLSSGISPTSDLSSLWRQASNYTETEGMAAMAVIKSQQRFNFASEDAAHFRNYTTDMEQIAYARMSVLSEGDGRGNRIIEVNNGSGLTFTVVPDRGMDIVEASFRGIPLAFRAPGGHVNPGKVESNGFGFLRSWAGGLLTTCGIRHVGPPEEDTANPLDAHRGLHGRISAQSAADVGIVREWRGNRYEIALAGTLREAMMFGENLRLQRKITTALGDNTIYVEDKISNLGSIPEFIQILYHCNLGYPAIAPGTRLEATEHTVTPRDAEAASGLENWHIIPEPQAGVKEQCFIHNIPATNAGWAEIATINDVAGLRITVAYDTATLPNLVQWKLAQNGRYVLGLEPTNATLSGRIKDIASGHAPKIEPGEVMTFRIRLNFNAF